MISKKLAVVGPEYVGLPIALMFAEDGFEVTGIDIDEQKVNGRNLFNKQECLDKGFIFTSIGR